MARARGNSFSLLTEVLSKTFPNIYFYSCIVSTSLFPHLLSQEAFTGLSVDAHHSFLSDLSQVWSSTENNCPMLSPCD